MKIVLLCLILAVLVSCRVVEETVDPNLMAETSTNSFVSGDVMRFENDEAVCYVYEGIDLECIWK